MLHLKEYGAKYIRIGEDDIDTEYKSREVQEKD